MIKREEALQLIEEHVENKNIIKHMFALEALMGELYDELKKRNKNPEGIKEEWKMAGLMHDGDYCPEVPPEKQGIQIVAWAKEKGYEIPDSVAHAIAAHNWNNTKIEPKNLMDWTIFCGDSLTGLIVAGALVLPSKKLSDLSVKSVLNRFKEKSFAKGTRREDIILCEKKLGLSLEEFVSISLKVMQDIAADLGL